LSLAGRFINETRVLIYRLMISPDGVEPLVESGVSVRQNIRPVNKPFNRLIGLFSMAKR